jgi:hypothetical protein
MVDQGVVDALNGAGLLPMAFQSVTAFAVMLCSFFIYRLFKEFDALKEEHKNHISRCPITHSKADLELANFKVFAEREYAKANTLSRIHSRIDDVFKLLAELKESKP